MLFKDKYLYSIHEIVFHYNITPLLSSTLGPSLLDREGQEARQNGRLQENPGEIIL